MLSILGKLHESRATNRTRRGFTLIEVLVVVGITTILAGMVLTYSSRGRNQVALYVEAAKLSQVILRAKSLAIATYISATQGPVCGYGVHIDYATGSYSLFSYNPVDCSPISISGGAINMEDAASNYKAIETNQLAQGVIYGVGSNDPNSPKLTDIFFIPPDPATLIWSEGSGVASNLASNVSLVSAADPQSGITVRASTAGQITF